jgi:folate-binding protein YgfZ
VFGPKAADALGAAGSVEPSVLTSLAPYGHINHKGGFWARVPDLGVDGLDVIAPVAAQQGIIGALGRAGAVELDTTTAEVLRVEAGRPAWGVDLDENTLAQEAALDRADLNAISFDKGCYTGQETVARVHFRGHVNRTLRGLRGDSPFTPGSTLLGADGAEVGVVRSAADSPRLGAIALGYVRREIGDGQAVTVRSSSGDATARVVPLPFA